MPADLFLIHLLGVTQEEAEASLAEHGDPKACSWKECCGAVSSMLLFKQPGNAWGQGITMAAACELHEEELLGLFLPITQDKGDGA